MRNILKIAAYLDAGMFVFLAIVFATGAWHEAWSLTRTFPPGLLHLLDAGACVLCLGLALLEARRGHSYSG